MSKFRYLLVFFALSLLPLSGCSLSSHQKAEMDKTLEDFYVTRFEFGTLGDVDVTTSKKLVIDGRNWNFSELLASIFQDALKDRGISVGKLTPTKGGAFLLDELRVAGRTLLLSPVWYPSGKIRATYMLPKIQNPNAKAITAIPAQEFLNVSKHYESDEALYEGLKAELRPHVDTILDEAFRRFKDYGLKKF